MRSSWRLRREPAWRALGRKRLDKMDRDTKNITGRKGRALFHPLRLALTGRETGPDLAALCRL